MLKSTVSRWFNHGFPVPGRLCVPNLVLYDKFRPGNIEKTWEYLEHVNKIRPERLKYGNKNSLKGKAIFNKLARRDVLTGLVPQTKTDHDLQNTLFHYWYMWHLYKINACAVLNY